MFGWKGALKYPGYRIYFLGQLISVSGSWMQQIAISWLAYRLTGSVLMLTAITFLTQIPILVLGFWTGSYADKCNKRRALIMIQLVCFVHAAVLSAMTKYQVIEGWHLLIFAFILGLVNAVETPLRQVYIASLIDNKEDLPSGIAINSLMLNSARIVGPSLAGIVLAWSTEANCFALNACSYLATVSAFYVIANKETPSSSEATTSTFEHFKDGYRVAMTDPWIKRSLVMMIVISLFAYPYTSLVPVFVSQYLQAGPDVYGMLMSVAAMGALCAGLLLATKSKVMCPKTLIAASAPVSGAAIFVFSSARTVLFAEASIFCIGFSLVLCAITTNILIQGRITDVYRGRIMTLYAMTMLGAMPFGCLILGWMSDLLGLSLALKISGCAVVLFSSILAMNMQKLLKRRNRSFQKSV